jgi:hypothetical protein
VVSTFQQPLVGFTALKKQAMEFPVGHGVRDLLQGCCRCTMVTITCFARCPRQTAEVPGAQISDVGQQALAEFHE